MNKVPWNRVIVDEFVSLALLNEVDERIIRTRAAGWSQVKQSIALNMSSAPLERRVRKLKEKYTAMLPYSDILPENLDF